ncbi:MAG: hypothetical protein PHF18_10180 [Methanosarcina sp.]|uniref:hypothetical protein n=1 Tax=Methanosarcina sp. TaxID=2213 RepID=UPI00261D4E5C|nr:hypothetical protein [Methanosarcina sp.]MDD3247198.1 hypothetical protein [Methanosarcina sp.]MDD4249266.1 hypothetical protein [Methanosarcina sp.]
MAKNTGEGRRAGAVKGRSQAYNPKTDKWVQFDENHKIMTSTDNPRKGVKGKGKK